MMPVKEIVKEWLTQHKYDGLFSESGECACVTNDLMPCDSEGIGCCEPGYLMDCDCGEEHDFHIGLKEEG